MAYLITIGERPDFRVNAEDFKDQLRSGWPSVEFERVMVPNDPLILHWKIEIGDDIQLGALHSDKQTISIDGFPASRRPNELRWVETRIQTRFFTRKVPMNSGLLGIALGFPNPALITNCGFA